MLRALRRYTFPRGSTGSSDVRRHMAEGLLPHRRRLRPVGCRVSQVRDIPHPNLRQRRGWHLHPQTTQGIRRLHVRHDVGTPGRRELGSGLLHPSRHGLAGYRNTGVAGSDGGGGGLPTDHDLSRRRAGSKLSTPRAAPRRKYPQTNRVNLQQTHGRQRTTHPPTGHFTRVRCKAEAWRWRRDLNPRTVLAVSRFQGECIRPLCHATADKSSDVRRPTACPGRRLPSRECRSGRGSPPLTPAATGTTARGRVRAHLMFSPLPVA